MKPLKLLLSIFVFLTVQNTSSQIIDNDFSTTQTTIPEVANVDNTYLNKWYTWNGASATVTTADGYGIMQPISNKGANFVIKENYPAGDYVVSFDFKKESGESKDIFVNSKSGPTFMTITLNGNSNGGEVVDAFLNGQVVATNVRFKIKRANVSSSWQTYSFDFNVPASFAGTQVYSAVSVGSMPNPGVFNLDNFTITEKTKTTMSVSVSDISSRVYPNPAKDIININSNIGEFSAS
ncbi:MAG: hypothetical protein ACPHXR_06580, partial [Flavicella sp.]